MSFAARTYPQIVRDLLTTLTGGTVAEAHTIGLEGAGEIRLLQAPVQRISFLEGQIAVGEELRAHQFTERDFELVADSDDPQQFVALRFRPRGKKPAPGSTLIVNYYPLRTKPTPLNDVNVGSVVRTLLETIAREMATQYAQLERVYESGFVESAKGVALENVAALVGVRRLTAGHPVGKARFNRRSGAPGAVFIPINTAITDGEGSRYLTSSDARMQPGQSNLEVWVHGELSSTPQLEPGALSVLERAIAGVDAVTNDEATFRAVEDETDDQLRARARRAIHGTGKGTLDAIRFGLESLPCVSAVELVELPNGVPGTLRVDVALREDNHQNRALVARRVEELRPAGIEAKPSFAGRIELEFKVELELADASAPTSEVEDIRNGVRTRLAQLVAPLAPGAQLRRARVLAAILADPRVLDAGVALRVGGALDARDAITLPQDRAPQLDATNGVVFGASSDGDSAVETIAVDLDLAVELLERGWTAQTVQTHVREALGGVIANLAPGGELSLDLVQTHLRRSTGFALVIKDCVVSLELAQTRFVELRSGATPFVIPAGASAQLRDVEVSAQESDVDLSGAQR